MSGKSWPREALPAWSSRRRRWPRPSNGRPPRWRRAATSWRIVTSSSAHSAPASGRTGLWPRAIGSCTRCTETRSTRASLPARRRELHQSIGEREEVAYGDRARDIAAELAAHFEQAGADRRAVRHLAEAADTATRRNANSEAAGYVGRALDLVERLPEAERVAGRLALLEQLGQVRRAMGDVRATVEGFEALARYAQIGRASCRERV